MPNALTIWAIRARICCPMFLNTGSGGIDIFEVKLTFEMLIAGLFGNASWAIGNPLGPVLSLCLHKVFANERRRYICNSSILVIENEINLFIFSHVSEFPINTFDILHQMDPKALVYMTRQYKMRLVFNNTTRLAPHDVFHWLRSC